MNETKVIIKKIKEFIKTTKGKIITLSSISVIVLIIIISIVVGISKKTNNNNNNNSKDIKIHWTKLTSSSKIPKNNEYSGKFKISANTKSATIDLESLKIPNSTLTLKGKVLKVNKGKITFNNGICSNILSKDMQNPITVFISSSKNPDNKIKLILQENKTADKLILSTTGSTTFTKEILYDLPLSW